MYLYIEARPKQKEKFGQVTVEITDVRKFYTAKEAQKFAMNAADSMPDYHTFEIWKISDSERVILWGYSINRTYTDHLQKEVDNEINH